MLTDATGAVRGRYEYDPYGRMSQVSGDKVSLVGFTGHFLHLASGLVLAPYRAYDPEVGRWISKDPIGLRGGINRYAYVAGNPTGLRDPDGLTVGPGHPDWVPRCVTLFHQGSCWDSCDVEFALRYLNPFAKSAVDLSDTGLTDYFRDNFMIRKLEEAFRARVRAKARAVAASLCTEPCGTAEGDFEIPIHQLGKVDSTRRPCLFAYGWSAFYGGAKGSVAADCSARTFGFAASLTFEIRDSFTQPIPGYPDLPFANVFDMTGKWYDVTSGGGSF